jgi:hypothetical protein
MVGHQAVCMYNATITPGNNFPQVQIELIILWFDKTGFTVIASLDDMVWQPRYVHP